MRTQTMARSIATAIFLLAASTSWAATLGGNVTLGGIFVDEEGDRSTVQETFDLYDGFAVSRIHLFGTTDSRNSFMLDLRDINLDSRMGHLLLRMPGRFRLNADYDQSRYVFDPGRGVTADRKDWRLGAQWTASPWLVLSGGGGYLTREGDRLAFPPGTADVLGDRYDHALLTTQWSADVQSGRRGGGLSLRTSNFSDDLNSAADRTGQVFAGRLYAPMPFYEKWNNLFRASYGTRKRSDGDQEWTLSGFQYTGILQPRDAWELRYGFDASRVKDESLDLQTDRIQNDVDVFWFHRYGRLNAGYGYETNDDDRTLTSYQSWRAGAIVRPDPRVTARVEYAGRVKKDQEELTLLKDIESSKVRAKLDVRPVERFTVGGDFTRRERDLNDIGVSVEGTVTGAFVRWDVPRWGSLMADYSHADDDYDDLLAPFKSISDIVTARVETGYVKNLTLASGVTYLDIGGDLDIEKSIVFVEGTYRLLDRYHLGVKYNAYNYDDYILLDRYYTANVVRVDFGYDLRP